MLNKVLCSIVRTKKGVFLLLPWLAVVHPTLSYHRAVIIRCHILGMLAQLAHVGRCHYLRCIFPIFLAEAFTRLWVWSSLCQRSLLILLVFVMLVHRCRRTLSSSRVGLKLGVILIHAWVSMRLILKGCVFTVWSHRWYILINVEWIGSRYTTCSSVGLVTSHVHLLSEIITIPLLHLASAGNLSSRICQRSINCTLYDTSISIKHAYCIILVFIFWATMSLIHRSWWENLIRNLCQSWTVKKLWCCISELVASFTISLFLTAHELLVRCMLALLILTRHIVIASYDIICSNVIIVCMWWIHWWVGRYRLSSSLSNVLSTSSIVLGITHIHHMILVV